MSDITISTVRQAIQNEQVYNLVADVVAKKVVAKATREQVDKVHAEILSSYPIYADMFDRTERIWESGKLYLCSDDSKCAHFYTEANRALREAGIKPAEMGDEYCPALVSETALIDAENALIKAVCDSLGVNHSNVYGRNRVELLDLVIGATLAQ